MKKYILFSALLLGLVQLCPMEKNVEPKIDESPSLPAKLTALQKALDALATALSQLEDVPKIQPNVMSKKVWDDVIFKALTDPNYEIPVEDRTNKDLLEAIKAVTANNSSTMDKLYSKVDTYLNKLNYPSVKIGSDILPIVYTTYLSRSTLLKGMKPGSVTDLTGKMDRETWEIASAVFGTATPWNLALNYKNILEKLKNAFDVLGIDKTGWFPAE